MSGPSVKRITVSLPPEVLEQLDLVAKAMGLSRSAFLSGLLGQTLPPICSLASVTPPDGSEGSSRRYRGELVSHINSMISGLQDELRDLEGQDDLFKE